MLKQSAKYFYVLGVLSLFVLGCRKYQDFATSEQDPRLSGGVQTAFDQGSGAFDHSFSGLSAYDQLIHDRGDKQFDQPFVTAPAKVNPGIGPIYNNLSCGSCHQSQGSGPPPPEGQAAGFESFFLRVSMNNEVDEHGGPVDVPGFGGQIQNNAVYGKQKEADYMVTYSPIMYVYHDGDTTYLRKPSYTIFNSYLPLPSNYAMTPRIAPRVFGMGLLENIGEATLLSMADENDANGDGISGKPNYVWDIRHQKMAIGRLGHKAEQPDIAQQIIIALNEDIGITSSFLPKESCYSQPQFYDDDLHPEISDSALNNLIFYLRSIAVPARRNVTDATVKRGEQIFSNAHCDRCHKPTLVTDVNVAFPQVSNQTIHPYTDLLLHDLGNGLADQRPVYSASGSEYRTCPLWGIGLTRVVTGQESYLHDGRARTLEEAILWHGGEAAFSSNYFFNLPKNDREALIAFLKSL